MQNMSTGVITTSSRARVNVYASRDRYPFGWFTGYNSTHMSAEPWKREVRINDRQYKTVATDDSDVSSLSTTLGVERSVIKEHFNT
jgi:hypothetical protein